MIVIIALRCFSKATTKLLLLPLIITQGEVKGELCNSQAVNGRVIALRCFSKATTKLLLLSLIITQGEVKGELCNSQAVNGRVPLLITQGEVKGRFFSKLSIVTYKDLSTLTCIPYLSTLLAPLLVPLTLLLLAERTSTTGDWWTHAFQ